MKKFYSGEGDDGYTALLGEGRVPKYDRRPEAYGTVDEASAALGLARAHARAEQVADTTAEVQRDLYHLMAELAASPAHADRFRVIDRGRVEWLEHEIDRFSAKVEIPKEFVISGDSLAGAAYDFARTVVRRAERLVAALLHHEELQNPDLLAYLNRLSSLCYVLSLMENQTAGIERPSLAKTSPE